MKQLERIAYLIWQCNLCSVTTVDRFDMCQHLHEKHGVEKIQTTRSDIFKREGD